MNYRLYLDESGDHKASEEQTVGKRYLGIAGFIFRRDAYAEFCLGLENLKKAHFAHDPDEPTILHREDIVQKRYPFRQLQDDAKRQSFDDALLGLIKQADFMVVAVVIDKIEHGTKKYRRLKHPYHYCLQAMLESSGRLAGPC
jgi:hypothetical protein